MSEYRPRLNEEEYDLILSHRNKSERRILVVGDIHAPFELKEYLPFCQNVYAKYRCNQVIFIGDLVDSHGWSYHEQDPDGLSAGHELSLAIKKIAQWYKAFPVADVCIGNHDRLASRKAFSGGVPSRWIKGYNDVLGTPQWTWGERFVYDDVQYIHGEGGTARTKAKNDMMSSVQGHIHTQAYVEWCVGRKFKVFGMQVGCGIDSTSYAAAYAKNFKKQAIGCGVVIGGHTAINIMMDL